MKHIRLLPITIAAHAMLCTSVWANGILDLARNGLPHQLVSSTAKPRANFPKHPAKLVTFVRSPSGEVIEKYSDGLTVQTDVYGNREAFKIPTNFLVCSAASSAPSISISEIYGTQGSYLQSCLLHCSQYYLDSNQPQKSEIYAQKYIRIQQEMEVRGLPLALGESILGETQLQMNHSQQAISFLESASEYFKNDKHSFTYATILYNLGNAYLKNNDLIAANRQFKLCRKIAIKNSYNDLLEKIKDKL